MSKNKDKAETETETASAAPAATADAGEVARLKAELASKAEDIEYLENQVKRLAEERDDARSVAGREGVARKAGRSRMDVRARQEERRRELMATTVKKDGKAYYAIPDGGQLYYREGATYSPGSVVAIPKDEFPSHTWEAVEEKSRETHLAAKGAPASLVARPQDREL